MRRSRKDAPEKLLDQLGILTHNKWPHEIYNKYRDTIEQLDPHKPREQTDERTYTAHQAFKEALISYYTGIAINVIHKKAEGKTCYLDATAGIGILPLHIKDNLYPIFGSAIIPLITPTIGEKKFRRKPKPFKYVILAEEDKARRELLRKVVQEVEQKLKKLRLPTPKIVDFSRESGATPLMFMCSEGVRRNRPRYQPVHHSSTKRRRDPQTTERIQKTPTPPPPALSPAAPHARAIGRGRLPPRENPRGLHRPPINPVFYGSPRAPGLPPGQRPPRLGEGFPLRCVQRLSPTAWLPGSALPDNRYTRGRGAPFLSY